MPKRGHRGIPGLSFSPSRALGISAAKRKFAKATGIPTTRAGRQRKLGAATGCTVVLAIPALAVLVGVCTIAALSA